MAKIEINLPEEIEHYAPDLRFFFDNMVMKLFINRHKGFGEGQSLKQLRDRIEDEKKELDAALTKESQFPVFMECVDVANFAWLVGLVALRMTKEEYEYERLRFSQALQTELGAPVGRHSNGTDPNSLTTRVQQSVAGVLDREDTGLADDGRRNVSRDPKA